MIALDRLRVVLQSYGRMAVAVSGGIDSLTLATAAHRTLVGRVTMHHATSPAVPPDATARTRALAAAEGWTLDVFDAGEFDDPAYRANPVNRCFYCKTNLYGAVASRTKEQIVSGTNLDDLSAIFRPGLQAAKEHNVRHPLVEAEIDNKPSARIAGELGLGALAELPSAPCLSSRVETGIRIEPPVLAMVHAAETLVTNRLSPRTVRCRVRAAGVVIELDDTTLASMGSRQAGRLRGDWRILRGRRGWPARWPLLPTRRVARFCGANVERGARGGRVRARRSADRPGSVLVRRCFAQASRPPRSPPSSTRRPCRCC